jgi:GNAT superfamily N-acetyltransferase
MDAKLADRATTRQRRGTGGRVLGRVRSLLWQRDEFRIYRYRLADPPHLAIAGGVAIRRDHAPDLDLYEPTAPWWLPKRKFLEKARERLAAGEHVYTITAAGRLVHYAWLADRRDEISIQEVDQTLHCTIPSAWLYDAYTAPEARGRGLHTRSVLTRLRDAAALAAAPWAYVGCLAANRASRRVIEKVGFVYYVSLHRMQLLGFARRWQATGRA